LANILHLIDQAGPGGAQAVFLDLVNRLARQRWTSVAAIPGPGWLADALRKRDIEPVVTPIKKGSFDVNYLVTIIKLVRQHRVKVIQAHLLTPAVYGSLAGALCRVPVFSTFHGHVDVSPRERFRRIKFGILNHGARRVVFVSRALQAFFVANTTLAPERTTVIPNGIDPSLFHPGRDESLRRELGVTDQEILIGAIGHLRPSKAYDVFLRAAAVLRQRSSKYRFVIVGLTDGVTEGAVYAEMVALRDALGLGDAVQFMGHREDIGRILRGLDVYVITSKEEGFSLSILQALACGVPVVATRCGGPEEILKHGESGLLVDVGAPDQIVAAVDRVLAEPETRLRLAEQGKLLVNSRFTLDRMVEAYEALYREVVPSE
jgi:glycosyltransferase involved in cell wall biosynthesis